MFSEKVSKGGKRTCKAKKGAVGVAAQILLVLSFPKIQFSVFQKRSFFSSFLYLCFSFSENMIRA